jgi:hypothetical protein
MRGEMAHFIRAPNLLGATFSVQGFSRPLRVTQLLTSECCKRGWASLPQEPAKLEGETLVRVNDEVAAWGVQITRVTESRDPNRIVGIEARILSRSGTWAGVVTKAPNTKFSRVWLSRTIGLLRHSGQTSAAATYSAAGLTA